MVLPESLTKLYTNPFLFSAILAVIVPFLILILGAILDAMAAGFMHFLGNVLHSRRLAFGIVNYLFFPGVMIHESAHALLALITGAKVEEVALFRKQGDSLGHVTYRNRGNAFLVMLQNVFISSAPMFIGAVVIIVIRLVLFYHPEMALWGKGLLYYLGISVFCHMTMSTADIKIYLRGVPLLIPILFVLFLGLRLSESV